MHSSEKSSFCDIYLKKFKINNPNCEILVEEETLVLNKPWETEDTRLVFEIEDIDFVKDLNNIKFRGEFDAIIHTDENLVEFIFGYLPDEEPFISYFERNFEVHFEGKKYECCFGHPTDRLFKIAKGVRRMPSDSGFYVVPQLKAFRDAQRIGDLPKRVAKYFDGKRPLSFFLKSEDSIVEIDLPVISKHINFISHYYDRFGPFIEIREKESFLENERVRPKRFVEEKFPDSLSIQRIDDIILRFIEVARKSPPRFAFLYYYQVFEYAGFYFVDEKAKKMLRNSLRDPSMINCSDEKINQLFSIFSDLNHNDDAKMRKVIEEYCDPSIIWNEIVQDKDFFSNPISFEGGFFLNALISNETSEATWSSMWMPKLFDTLTKIRNCLVHARERRQSNVILPTISNNRQIERFVPIIKRCAEQIAIFGD